MWGLLLRFKTNGTRIRAPGPLQRLPVFMDGTLEAGVVTYTINNSVNIRCLVILWPAGGLNRIKLM